MKKINDQRKAFLIKYLALKTPYPKIRQDYQKFFETSITGEEIMDIESKYSSYIEEVAKKELIDIRKNALAHPRIRLEFIYQGLTDAATPKPIRSIRVGETEYETVLGVDHQAIINYLKLAHMEEYSAKKLLLDKIKMDIEIVREDSGFIPVEVDTGFYTEDIKQIEQKE